MTDPLFPTPATLKVHHPDAGTSADEARLAREPLVAMVVSRDRELKDSVKAALTRQGVSSMELADWGAVAQALMDLSPALAVVDMAEAPDDPQAAILALLSVLPDAPVILVCEPSDRDTAINLVDQGAYDFVEQPVSGRALSFALRRAVERARFAVSEQKQRLLLEETVEEANSVIRRKEFLQGILDSSTLVSVVLTDLDQNVLFWNKGAENIFGYAADEMLGRKITRLYPPGAYTDETVDKLREMVKAKSGAVYGKMEQIAKDNRVRTVSLVLSPMIDATGELRGILGMGLDSTEEVRLHRELLKSFSKIRKIQDASIFSLAKLAESRDEETGRHLIRIQKYCSALAQQLAALDEFKGELTPEAIEDLARSSVLHDIGKVGVPDSILMSHGKFTPEEFEIMKRHPIIGGDALDEAVKDMGEESYLSMARDIAYYHHERWDGAGYPFGKAREEIPLSARIVALADVYDALTSRRRYKPPFTHEQARAIIVEGKGRHFDPDLVDAFLLLESDFSRIREAFAS